MDWIEKIYHLQKLESEEAKNGYQGEYFIDICYEIRKWEKRELEELIKPYPWLPESYINFIKEFDNLGLAFCTFYGSKGVGGITIQEEIEYFQPIIGMDYFPFGKYADGSLFAISKDGIVYFFNEDDCFETKEKCADSFKDFVEECLIGKRYNEFAIIEDNTYYDLLKSLGWA